jgi:hypothetical protein
MMSGMLSMSRQTSETLSETKNVMRLTKWITIVPLICTGPAGMIAELLEINPDMISLRIARCSMCLYMLCPVFNALLTLPFARPYHSAMKNICKKTRLTSLLFSWIIERRRIEPENDKNDIKCDPVMPGVS